jgi:hypothetical protein
MSAVFNNLIRQFVFVGLAMFSIVSTVRAGHYDVVPYASGTVPGSKILTGAYDDLGELPTEQIMRVYGYDFGETAANFADGPGFNNMSAFTNGVFPNNGMLPAGGLTLSIVPGAYGALRYWDGTGAASFAPVTGGVEINVSQSHASINQNLRVSGSSTSGSLLVWNILGTGGANGRVHQHLESSIGVGGSGSSFDTLGAPDGIYAFGGYLSVGGLVSDPIYFVFNQGMSEEIHDEGIDFYSAQVVPEPSSIALAGLGIAGSVLAALRRRLLRTRSGSGLLDSARVS